MKRLFVPILSLLLFTCNATRNTDREEYQQKLSKLEQNVGKLKTMIEELKNKPTPPLPESHVYKPGFGAIMGSIQHHHAKL